jgi:UDP-N-acetylglucosamine acyltransferase
VSEPAGITRPPVIHPTAIVHGSARLEHGVEIGPYAVVGANAVIGAGTVVGAHSVIHDDVTLGRNNQIEPHVVIGGRPQDRSYSGERTRTVIGDANIFSAFASVDRASGEGLETRMGSGIYLMSFAKVSHNCAVGDGVTIVSGAQIGGWAYIGPQAYLGGLSGVHQFVHIGRLAMIAGMSGVSQDVPPFILAEGRPGRARGLNRVGLQRQGVQMADRLALRRAFRIYFQSNLSLEASLPALDEEAGKCGHVREFQEFIQSARDRKRGVVRWQEETIS